MFLICPVTAPSEQTHAFRKKCGCVVLQWFHMAQANLSVFQPGRSLLSCYILQKQSRGGGREGERAGGGLGGGSMC